MLNFLRKLFGKNVKDEPERAEPFKEQPIVTPKPEGLEKSTHAAAVTEAQADVSREQNLTSTKDDEVSVKDFDSPLVEESGENEPVYDIKTHKKGWQVILPGAQRATRVLDTKKEAIEYCKENNYKYNVK